MSKKDEFHLSEEDLKEFNEFQDEYKKWEQEIYPKRAEFFEEERRSLLIKKALDESFKGKRRKLNDEEKYLYKLLVIKDNDERTFMPDNFLIKLNEESKSFLVQTDVCLPNKAIGKLESQASIKAPFNLVFLNCSLLETEKISLCKEIKTNSIISPVAILLATNSKDDIKRSFSDCKINTSFSYEELRDKLQTLSTFTNPSYPVYEILDGSKKEIPKLQKKVNIEDKGISENKLFKNISNNFDIKIMETDLENLINEFTFEDHSIKKNINKVIKILKQSGISNKEDEILIASEKIERYIRNQQGVISYIKGTKGIKNLVNNLKSSLGIP